MENKRIGAFLLSVLLLVSCVPLHAFAADDGAGLTAPSVQVPGDLMPLATTRDEAPEYVKQSIRVSWGSVSGATKYSLVVAKEKLLGWEDLLSEDINSVCSYTIPDSLFNETGVTYRLSVSASNDLDSETAHYYFVIVEQTKDTQILVNGDVTSVWDISARDKCIRTFSVASELGWTVENPVDWIAYTQTEEELTLEVAENSGDIRYATVTLTNGENSVAIQVNQGIGSAAPTLSYPQYSQDAASPTGIPVGGMILDIDTNDANYAEVAVYEGIRAEESKLVFRGNTTARNYYPVLSDAFEAGKTYLVELSGHYSLAYQENEESADVLASQYFVKMEADGHEILVNGTSQIEKSWLSGSSVKLYSAGAWTWTSDVDWMAPESYETVSYKKDQQIVEIELEPNYTSQMRTGTITFFCGDAQATLTVTQGSCLPRFSYPSDVSQDMNNPSILPSNGFVATTVAQEGSYATYEDGTWSEETAWGSYSEVTESSTLYPDAFFSSDVLYRFTLMSGEQTAFYYAKFAADQTEPYAVFYESYEHHRDLHWDVTAAEYEEQIAFYTSGAWTLASDVSWLSVSASSGTAATSKKKVTVTVAENTTGTQRVGTLTLTSKDGAQASLQVTQAAQDYVFVLVRDDDNDYRFYDPATSCKTEDGSGSTVYFTVWSNGDHTVESDESWITCSSSKLKLAENTTGAARYGTVTISCGNASQEIVVGQVAQLEAPVVVSPSLSADSANPSMLEYGDMTLTWNAVEGAVRYWISVKPNDTSLYINNFYSFEVDLDAPGTDICSCTIPASAFTVNGDGYDRVSIYAYDEWGYKSYTRVYLLSTRGEAAIINGTMSPVWGNATDLETSNTFTVRSTSDWTAWTDDFWIGIDKTAGSDGDTITVSLSQNYGNARTGEVFVMVGSTTTVLTIQQCAYLPMFPSILSPALSDDSVVPTVIHENPSEIRVVWDYEPQAEYYKVTLKSFKSDTVQTIEASSPKLYEGEYVFTDLSLVVGQRYCISISRKSHWGYTGKSYYFTLSDENAFVLVDGQEELELELDGEEDYAAVQITSSGVWSASVSDSWILVDNERIRQADLDAEDETAEEYSSYSGKSGDRLYISVLENTTNGFRRGTVTLRCSGVETVITVIQEPYYELAQIYNPVLGEKYKSAVGMPYGDLTVYWSKPVGGNGKCDLVLTECYEGTSKGEVVYRVTDLTVTYLTIPKRYLREGYYYELRLDTQLNEDPDDNRCDWYYFHVQYENALTASVTADWSAVASQGLVSVRAGASGGSGEYLYTYELLCNGVQKSISLTDSMTKYSFPIGDPGTYQVRVWVQDSEGTSVSALSEKFVVEELEETDEADLTPPQVVWDNSAQETWIGEEFTFSGTITSQNRIDKIHVDVTRAGTTSSIDYYRMEGCNAENFDLANIPSFVVGDVLNGLKVTNDQDTLSVYSGDYFITIWATDTQGISNGGITKTITVRAQEESAGALPAVAMQTAAAETTSSVKMQAKVTDLKDGIITQYGFNLYQNEDDVVPISVYNKASGVIYSTLDNTFVYTASMIHLTSGVYVEAFAVYYLGEEERMGVSERLYVAPKDSAFTFYSPANGQILGEDLQVDVSGWVRPVPYQVLIYLYDSEYNELKRYSASLTMEGVFETRFTMEEYREKPGKYYIQAVCNSGGNRITSQYISLVVPGGIEVQMQPVSTSTIGVDSAVVQAAFQDYQDKTLTDYGIYLYENPDDTVPVARYSKSYKNGGTIQLNSGTGLLSVTAAGLSASKTYYAQAFVVYTIGGAEIVSVSETRQAFTTRAVSALISTPQNNTVVENNEIVVTGTIRNRSASVAVTGVTVYLKNAGGSTVASKTATVNGNSFSATINTEGFAAGTYSVQVRVTSNDGYTTYTASRKVTVAEAIHGVGLYNLTEGYHVADGAQFSIAQGYHVVLQVLAEPDVSAIKSIEWNISDAEGVRVTEWANNYDNSHPHTYQLNALKAGSYTLTAVVHNYDGTSVSTTISVKVTLLTILTVMNYYTMLPVVGAEVAVEDYERTFFTDGSGQIFLDDLTGDMECEVAVSHMAAYEVEEVMQIKAGRSNIIFTYQGNVIQKVILTEKWPLPNGDSDYDQTDVIKKSVALDYTDTKTTLMLSIQAHDPIHDIVKYEIVQGGKVLMSNSVGVFSWIDIQKFNEVGAVYVRTTNSAGGVNEKKINLSFYRNLWDGSLGLSSGNVDIGSKFELKMPSDSPLAGHNMTIDLCNLPINIYSSSDGIVRLAVGFKEIFDLKANGLKTDEDVKELYDGCKTFIENVQKQGLETALTFMQYDGLKTSKTPIDFEFNPNVYVWVEYDTKTCDWSVALATQLEAEFQKDFQLPCAFPVVVSIEGKGSFEGELSFGKRQMENQYAANELLQAIFETIAGELTIKASVSGGLGAGIGYANLATVTVNASVKLEAMVQFPTTYGSAIFSSDGFIRAKLFSFEYNIPYYNKSWLLKEGTLLDEEDDSLTLMGVYGSGLNCFAPAERSYADETTDWYEPVESDSAALMGTACGLYDVSDVKLLMSSIYPDTQMQVVETEQDKVMVWLTDDVTREANNRAKLVYSVFDPIAGKWTVPQSVWEDGTLDGNPQLASDGEHIFVVWVNLNKAFTEDMTLQDALLCSEISVARFDSDTQTFGQIKTLTSDAALDSNPSIGVQDGQAVVAWLQNSAGDAWAVNGMNAIYTASYANGSWSDAEELTSVVGLVSDVKAGYLNGAPHVAYGMDQDSDFDTVSDIQLHVVDVTTGAETTLGTPGANGALQYAQLHGEQILIWSCNGTLVFVSAPSDAVTEMDSNLTNLANFHLVSNTYGAVVLQTVAGEDGSELYVSVYDEEEDAWSGMVRLTYQENGYINDYSAFLNARNEVEIVFVCEKDGKANLYTGGLRPIENISLEQFALDNNEAGDEKTVFGYATVTNHGLATIEEICFAVSDDGTLLSESVVAVELKSGESLTVPVPVQVPATTDVKTFQITAVTELEEAALEDNVAEFKLGYTDLALSYEEFLGDGTRMLEFTVTNESGYASGATICLYEGNRNGTLLATLRMDMVEGRSYAVQSVVLDAADMDIYVEVLADRAEEDTQDNAAWYHMTKDENAVSVATIREVTETGAALCLNNEQSGICLVAIYDEAGKLLTCGYESVEAYEGEITISLPGFDATELYMACVFLVDEDYVPLCECVSRTF